MSSAPLAVALFLAHRVAGYSWNFQEPAKQCSDLTIQITGNDGRPPYRVLIIPVGPTPLPNNVEARTILDVPFNGTSASVTWQLKYPQDSQFVAVVSDASGFGSGGTSVVAQVASSSNASCFDAKTTVSPSFFFSIDPPNQIVTCSSTRIWWDPATVQGNTQFQGVIPGGQSFSIPETSITQVPNQGTGFLWKANLRSGTTLIVVGGDNRGTGSAGSSFNVVSPGIAPDASCLDTSSPSSTPGSPAGGSYPTGSTGSGGNSGSGGSGGSNNTGAIVGGVVGSLVALIALFLVLFFNRKQRRDRQRQREKPVDLLNADEEDGDERDGAQNDNTRRSRNELPQFYQPEPFTVPDPTITTAGGYDSDSLNGRPLSAALSAGTGSFYTGTHPEGSAVFGAGATSSTGRKGAPPRMMRPVNIIQHHDAGPSYPPQKDAEEEETIELPPAYTALRRDGVEANPPPPPAESTPHPIPTSGGS